LSKAITKKAKANIKNNKKLKLSCSRSRSRSNGSSGEEGLKKELRCISREASDDELEADFYNYKNQNSDCYSDKEWIENWGKTMHDLIRYYF